MNKIYRTIWNSSKNEWVAVSEFTVLSGKIKNSLFSSNKGDSPAPLTSKYDQSKRINIKISLLALIGILTFSVNANSASDVDKLSVTLGTGGALNVYNAVLYEKYFPDVSWKNGQLSLSEDILIGKGSVMLGNKSGTDTKSPGTVVLGANSRSIGFGNTGIGSGTYTENSSTAVGTTAIANDQSTSIGRGATAENKGIAIGMYSHSSIDAQGGMALGNSSRVTAKNAVAIGMSSVASAENEVSFGNASLKRKLTNISAGSSDNDAVNFAQLSATNEIVTKNTDDIAGHTTAITTINNSLTEGTLGLVQLSADGKNVVLSDKAKDATVFEFGGKKLSGVSNAALAADSTEAVNGSQLFATNEQVTANTDGITQHTADIAGNKADIAKNTTDIAGNKTAITQNTTDITKNTSDIAGNTAAINQNTADITGNKADITKNTTDIAKNTGDITTINNNLAAGTLGLVQLSNDGKKVVLSDKAKDAMVFEFGDKKLSGVSDGELAADSTEAVNGSQLFATNKQVTDNTNAIAQNTTDITKNTNEITAISKNLDSGSLGLVQLNADGKRVVLSDKADGARVFDFNNRTLSGVSAGRVAADSSEAVNGSQLHATNQNVEKNTQSIKSNTDKLAAHESSITQNTNNIQANTNKLAEHDAVITKNTNDIKENTNRLE